MPKKEKFYIILKSHVFLPEAEKQIMGGGKTPAEGVSILLHIFHVSRWQSHLHFAALASDIT